MIEKIKEIKEYFLLNSKNEIIETMYLVADFSKMKSIADYEKLVQDKLSKMDVGILILNAGVGGLGPFLENTNEEIETNVNVNALHVIYFAKVMGNQLVKRFD